MARCPRLLLAALLAGPALAPAPMARAQAAAPAEQLAAASALFDAGKYAQAAKTLDAFLLANPHSPRAGAAALALGRCRSELKQYALAVPAYGKAIAGGDPKVTTVADLGLGEAALQTGQWAKAAGALGAATRAGLTPDQAPVALGWLGQADYQMGKYADAALAYGQVLDKYPGSDAAAEAYFGAGLSALKLGQAGDARRRLKTFADKYPGSEDRPQALLLLGQIDMDAGQYAQARDEFQGALDAPGADAETRRGAQEGVVSALLKLGDNAGAASRVQALLAALPPGDPQRPRAELTLGRSLYLQKQYAPAEAAYARAASSPDAKIAAEGAYWAANAALAAGHTADAATRFAAVSSQYPASAFAARARAKVAELKTAARQDAADRVLQQARLDLAGKKYAAVVTALSPGATQSAESRYLLGLAWQGLGKPAPAAKALASAVAAAPQADWVPDAQVQLAWVSLDQKRPVEAEAAARAAFALSASPGYSPALEQQARLALVQADLDQKKWDDALAGCRVLMAGSPSPDVQATVLFTQCWVSEKQGKADDALDGWQRLASEFPQSQYAPDALLHLGDAGFKAGKYDDARARYADLVTKYPGSVDAPQARLGLGNALYSLSRYAEAAQAFDALTSDPAADDLKPEALYWAGASWEKAGKKAEAIPRLTRLVREFPTSARVANAKVRLAGLKAGG